MHRRFGRLAALLGAGALALAITAPVFAAEPLTAVVTANDNETPTAGQSWVRVLHGSPDAPEVDVYVGTDLATAEKVDALSGLSFGEISGYAEVPPGTYAVKVCATADDSICPIEVPELELMADTKYTVTASDELASIDVNVFVDDPDTAETAEAQVRVVHLSADTPAVDVLTQDGTSIGINGLAYGERQPDPGYAKFPAGSYDLKVCAAETTDVCPLDPKPLNLDAGMAYSVFAIGSLAALTPEPSTAPEVTPPPTDALGTTDSSSGTGIFAALGLLGIAALGSIVMGRRLAARRVEK